MQEPPVLVVERSKAKDYDLFLKKASQRKPAETDKLSFTFGYLLRSRDPQWLNHAISTVWRHLRRPSKDYVLGQLWPTVQNLLKNSTAFVKMELFRFELGSIPPRVQKIEVQELETDEYKLVIDVDLSWSSEASVHLQLFTGFGCCPLKAETRLRVDNDKPMGW